MSLTQLRTFLAVYRRRSLTQGARQLRLTQPAASQQIASLESQIGKTLFIRSRRGVDPTPIADELARALGDSLDRAEAVLAGAKARSSQLSGTLHIAGPAEYIGERYVEALARLAASGIELRVRLGGRDVIYRHLLAGDVDLAITASPPQDARLDGVALAEERLVLVCQDGVDPPPPLELLGRLPFCAYDVELPLIREWCAANNLAPPPHPPKVLIPDLRTLVRFVEHGSGWTVLPDYLIEEPVRQGRVRIAYPSLRAPSNSLYLLWARGGLRQPRIAYAREMLMSGVPVPPVPGSPDPERSQAHREPPAPPGSAAHDALERDRRARDETRGDRASLRAP